MALRPRPQLLKPFILLLSGLSESKILGSEMPGTRQKPRNYPEPLLLPGKIGHGACLSPWRIQEHYHEPPLGGPKGFSVLGCS